MPRRLRGFSPRLGPWPRLLHSLSDRGLVSASPVWMKKGVLGGSPGRPCDGVYTCVGRYAMLPRMDFGVADLELDASGSIRMEATAGKEFSRDRQISLA